jgi:antitoxin YefM
MPVETTYSSLRGNLASFLDRAADDREVVIVRRRGARDVALIAADELEGVMETAHLLRSPRNARRLADSLAELERGGGKAVTVTDLRKSLGLNSRK